MTSPFQQTQYWHDTCRRADDATLAQINHWYRAAHLPGFNRIEDVPLLPSANDYTPAPRRSATAGTRKLLARANHKRASLGLPLISLA